MLPRAGVDFPASYSDMLAWFPDDDACLDYLAWLRWRDGFDCPHCGSDRCWDLGGAVMSCAGCKRRVSVTAGTVLHRTRTPMTVWFAAVWYVCSQKDGASALGLQRVLGLGSYQTAWTMLHRLRSAMIRPGRELLDGDVEVDEVFVGGRSPGSPGRTPQGKVIVAVAVETKYPKGFGRCRLSVIPNSSAPSLHAFLSANVEPGAVLLTDGWSAYPPAIRNTWTHKPTNVSASGQPAHLPLPGVHRIASLVKRWLLSTHQGAVRPDHLQAYLDEFAFRFNRRSSKDRGMLFYRLLENVVQTSPMTYRSLVANPTSRPNTTPPPRRKRVAPASLTKAPVGRPWRR